MIIERKPTTLLFDLDGTLSNPLQGIARSINHALTRHGREPQPESALAHYVGPPVDEIFRLVTRAPENEIMALVATFRERYADIGYGENVLYPGIREALDALIRKGLHLGICTSKPAEFAEKILRKFEIREQFACLSGGGTGIAKRDQIGTLLQTGEIGSATVMIGDRASDIMAARAHGLDAIGVLWGFGSYEELSGSQPRALLRRVDELSLLAV